MSTKDHITIKIGGEERELFMSFGLLNELTTIVADPGRVAAIPVDPELRKDILLSALAERKPSGKILKAVEDYDDLDISMKDAEDLLDWVMEHCMGFFVRSLQKVAAVTRSHESELKDLSFYLNGSQDSTSNEPSSGPSA